jgi:hypothetical protein
MDPTKQYGDACTPHGGLKEAHEIEWLNDLDDVTSVTNSKSVVNAVKVKSLFLLP